MTRYQATLNSPDSREALFDYLADFRSTAEWDPGVKAARLRAGEPGKAGAEFEITSRFAGRDVPLVYRAVEVDPPRRVLLVAESSSLVSRDEITVDASDDGGTAVTYTADLRLRGPLRLFDPVLQASSSTGSATTRETDWRRTSPSARRAPRSTGGMRVAIVGAGVSGLAAAYDLRDAGNDVHLFEAADHPGGHANTIRVETESRRWDVDTGFIVFNDRNYPNFERLLDRAGRRHPAGRHELLGVGPGRPLRVGEPARRLFANPAHLLDPRFHRMLPDLVRFNRDARALIGTDGEGPRCATSSPERRLLRLLHRAIDRAPGIRGLVSRPGSALVVSGQLPCRVLRQPRHPPGPRPAALAHDRPAARGRTSRRSSPRCRVGAPAARRCAASSAVPIGSTSLRRRRSRRASTRS